MARGYSARESVLASAYSAGEPPAVVADIPPKPERLAEAVYAARELRANVLKVEPALTKSLMSIAKANGGQMIGLEQRLKSTDSLARKIGSDAQEARYNGDHEKAAKDIGDAVRYTMSFDEGKYTAGITSALEALKKDGYELVAVKNFWKQGDPYQGINVKLSKGGVFSELQFHTPDSFDTKEVKTHKMYEELRESKDSAQKEFLWKAMTDLSNKVKLPKDYAKLLAIGVLSMQTL
jgi:hypothetical protein